MKFDVDEHPYIFIGICLIIFFVIPALVWELLNELFSVY